MPSMDESYHAVMEKQDLSRKNFCKKHKFYSNIIGKETKLS